MKALISFFAKPILKVRVPLILIVLLNQSHVHSQNGWQEKRFYAYKGGSDVICGAPYHLSKWNDLGSWIETWQNCRRRVWHQEFYSGFIYYWGPKGWYREWKEGNYWYFNWFDYTNTKTSPKI